MNWDIVCEFYHQSDDVDFICLGDVGYQGNIGYYISPLVVAISVAEGFSVI